MSVLCMYMEGWVFVYVCLSMCVERFGCECGGRNGYEFVSERLGCTFAGRDEGVYVFGEMGDMQRWVCVHGQRDAVWVFVGVRECVFEKQKCAFVWRLVCLCGGRSGGICRGTDSACLKGRMGYCVSVCVEGETWCVCGEAGLCVCL